MLRTWMRGMILAIIVSGTIAALSILRAAPEPSNPAAQRKAADAAVDAVDIEGVVMSAKGPEAGVWVIAETSELPTKFRKIVVTDDRGRYLIPDLPQTKYKVFVRGYGLVDSGAVEAKPGQRLDLRAAIAPDAKAAAQYYPANYWFSLVQAPPKSAFPMTITVNTSETSSAPGFVRDSIGPGETGAMQKRVVKSQADWVDAIKDCEICHQLGSRATREISPSLGEFDSPALAWDRRLRMGQTGMTMAGMVGAIGRENTEAALADWTTRIGRGEVPPAPPRPAGVERNLVISMWDVGTPVTFAHDLYTTDKRNPTVNAYGPVYLGDYNTGYLHILDPKRNTDESVKLPTRDDPKTMERSGFAPETMQYPSLYWGNELIYEEIQRTEVKNVDDKGRLWMATVFRSPDNPAYCKEGSSNKFAKYFPLNSSGRQAAYLDGKTKKETWVDTCFSTHHTAFAEDKDQTIYWVGTGTVLGWIKPGVLDAGGSAEEAQGWCPAYYDMKGDGVYDPKADKLVTGFGYYVTYNPVDRSVWFSVPGTPGKIVRMDVGSNPPYSCRSEVYEPPFNNPKAAGKLGYFPRGIDIDRNGLIWTGLAGSGQLASFDRSKCKVLTGPESFTGQQCPEGWTLYDVPGPQMKNLTDGGSADFLYGNWVDQFNTLGLGKNVPIATGTDSDALLALLPDTHKWVVLRVPYPLGFFTRNLTGRIDDPNAGWKGRGLWAGNEVRNPWHQEGGKGMRSEAVHFQLRPDPLAK
jgi:hypothetical protein